VLFCIKGSSVSLLPKVPPNGEKNTQPSPLFFFTSSSKQMPDPAKGTGISSKIRVVWHAVPGGYGVPCRFCIIALYKKVTSCLWLTEAKLAIRIIRSILSGHVISSQSFVM
jgi:hypothetical protein